MSDASSGRPEPRRRDATATRNRLVVVAGRHFAQHGYDGASVRAIAADAGVAPNLITRYFGGKAGLFEAATKVQVDLRGSLPGPFETLGLRIARQAVGRWENAEEGDPVLMLLRSSGTSPEAAQALGEFFAAQAKRPLGEHLVRTLGCSPEEAADRVAAVQALIVGVVTSRYVMPRGHLAQPGPEALTAWLGDQLQRLLDGPPPPSLSASEG